MAEPNDKEIKCPNCLSGDLMYNGKAISGGIRCPRCGVIHKDLHKTNWAHRFMEKRFERKVKEINGC